MIQTQSQRQVQKVTESNGISGRLITVSDPASAASEAYRTLRAKLLLYEMADQRPRVILVTSSGRAEGKSTVCANLGAALAQVGESTLIMDCNFRAPAMHEIFSLSDAQGLTEVLSGECTLREAHQEPLPGLKVLAAGAVSSDPDTLPDPRSLARLLYDVRQEFDYVLLDSSPLGMVSDSAILAAHADGVLLTMDMRKTGRDELYRAMRGLRDAGANVLGTVMNSAA